MTTPSSTPLFYSKLAVIRNFKVFVTHFTEPLVQAALETAWSLENKLANYGVLLSPTYCTHMDVFVLTLAKELGSETVS